MPASSKLIQQPVKLGLTATVSGGNITAPAFNANQPNDTGVMKARPGTGVRN
jgi:hypothetical protein